MLLAILAVDSVKLAGSKKSPCTVEWAVTFATYPREALPTAKAPKRPGSTPLWRGEPMTGLVPKIIPSQFLGARVPGGFSGAQRLANEFPRSTRPDY